VALAAEPVGAQARTVGTDLDVAAGHVVRRHEAGDMIERLLGFAFTSRFAELRRWGRLREGRLSVSVEFVLLEVAEDFLGAGDDLRGEAGEESPDHLRGACGGMPRERRVQPSLRKKDVPRSLNLAQHREGAGNVRP